MSDLDLAPIVERHAATSGLTYGRWESRHRHELDWLSQSAQRAGHGDDHQPGSGVSVVPNADPHLVSLWPHRNAIADAEFVAHAHQDIPALVDEVRKLRAIVERVRSLARFADRDVLGHPVVMVPELEAALVDQCHHIDGEAECWHFGDRDGRDG
jgi:hypothetical protein